MGDVAAGLVDEPQLAGLMLREAWRRLGRQVRGLPLGSLRLGARPPERPLAVPLSLRRGDAAEAEAIYGGSFRLAGHLARAGAESPFIRRDRPRAWLAELHGFGWLAHFTQAGDALARVHAGALVAEWLRLPRRSLPPVAFEPDTAACRLISWLAHAPTVLAGADPLLRRRFMKRLLGEAATLRAVGAQAPDGVQRLRVRIAVALAALCLPARPGQMKTALRHLGAELDRQVFPDGGHVSRNPAAVVAILADLIPLREAFAREGQPLPRSVFSAVDRMLPALRFLRHSDGAVALFNGGGVTDAALVAALLEYDETLGEPIGTLRQSGYQRLAQNGTVLLADTGLPPAPHLSGDAHAGTLGFELSSGRRRIVVNCGAPGRADEDHRRLARSTAAHSTLTVADRSSSRFARSGALDRFLGGPLVPGPTRVPQSREDDESGQRLLAAHDGYRARFGLVHERTLFLARDGRLVEGRDRLFHAGGRTARGAEAGEPEACLRFHLHPDVQAEKAGRGIRLFAKGDVWWFFTDGPATIEDSVHFAESTGARRTFQLVVGFDRLERTEIAWRFERHA